MAREIRTVRRMPVGRDSAEIIRWGSGEGGGMAVGASRMGTWEHGGICGLQIGDVWLLGNVRIGRKGNNEGM